MITPRRISSLLFITLLGFSNPAISGDSHHDEHEHHDHDHKHHDDHHDHDHGHSDNLDAHVHGLAQLTIAVDDDEIEIAFTSPSDSIVGFEYRAKTDEEKAAVGNAKKILTSATELFAFEGTFCELEHAHPNLSALMSEGHDDHDHHEHDHDHKEHGKEHGHDEGVHSEVSAEFHYACEETKKLEHIEVKLFEAFPRIETINAQWLTHSGQGVSKLSSKQTHIELR